MRVEAIANVMIFMTALFCIVERDNLRPGLAALSLTYALNIIGSVVSVVRMACNLENICVALERIFEYTNLPPEAEWNFQDKDLDNWPNCGKINFSQFQTCYRKGMEPVLNKIDLNIESQQKIGICGRTGAGKSSLTLSLFRLIEATNGQILIDDVDVSKLGLHQLRSKLAIIPQVNNICFEFNKNTRYYRLTQIQARTSFCLSLLKLVLWLVPTTSWKYSSVLSPNHSGSYILR